jgi:hypothetical protein
MSYNTEVKITVKVDGQKVAKRTLTADVGSLGDGQRLLRDTNEAVFGIANELRTKAGV